MCLTCKLQSVDFPADTRFTDQHFYVHEGLSLGVESPNWKKKGP